MGGRFAALTKRIRDAISTLVEIMSFCPRNRVKTKEKRSSPQFRTIFGRILRNLFVLTGPFLSDHPALKSRWGDASPRVPPTI